MNDFIGKISGLWIEKSKVQVSRQKNRQRYRSTTNPKRHIVINNIHSLNSAFNLCHTPMRQRADLLPTLSVIQEATQLISDRLKLFHPTWLSPRHNFTSCFKTVSIDVSASGPGCGRKYRTCSKRNDKRSDPSNAVCCVNFHIYCVVPPY